MFGFVMFYDKSTLMVNLMLFLFIYIYIYIYIQISLNIIVYFPKYFLPDFGPSSG